ncbi:TetR family transcriptional regulator [Arthrobacter sp.]|uniref:TetR/AcrR family transcriptional regulator n=1 Tax=Arthrobacter sp. TaxID=1667 RepID=UPI0033981D9F
MKPEPSTPLRQRPAGTVGRVRDLGRDTRILEAALDLISEQGPSAISMEAVAARAGVGKSTVYRRWGSLPDLLADAVDTITFPATPPVSRRGLREDLIEGIIAASGCMDTRRQRIISALLNTSKDQTELVEALRVRFINAIAAAIAAAVETPRENQGDPSEQTGHIGQDGHAGDALHAGKVTNPPWPYASIDLAVVIGLLTSLPHITARPLERADFERIVDEVLLPLWASRGYPR